MSGTGLDYATRRKVREFIRANAGVRILTAQQIVVHFRLRPDDEPDVRELLTEAAILGPLEPATNRPEVLTPPAEVLDQLVLEVAAAPSGARMLLVLCEFCRNHLLYLLDTAPYTDSPEAQITARLKALPEVHKAHSAKGPDRDEPRIRWIMS